MPHENKVGEFRSSIWTSQNVFANVPARACMIKGERERDWVGLGEGGRISIARRIIGFYQKDRREPSLSNLLSSLYLRPIWQRLFNSMPCIFKILIRHISQFCGTHSFLLFSSHFNIYCINLILEILRFFI